MTCNIGYVAPDGSVWIGCDTAVGNESLGANESKLFQISFGNNQKLSAAASGSGRIIQLIWNGLDCSDVPLESDSVSIEKTLSIEFVTRISTLLTTYGCIDRTTDGKTIVAAQFLVATPGRLYRFNQAMMYWKVHGSLCPFTAIGCGEDFALGAMRVLTRLYPDDPQRCIETALEAVAYMQPGDVRAPFHIKKIE